MTRSVRRRRRERSRSESSDVGARPQARPADRPAREGRATGAFDRRESRSWQDDRVRLASPEGARDEPYCDRGGSNIRRAPGRRELPRRSTPRFPANSPRITRSGPLRLSFASLTPGTPSARPRPPQAPRFGALRARRPGSRKLVRRNGRRLTTATRRRSSRRSSRSGRLVGGRTIRPYWSRLSRER